MRKLQLTSRRVLATLMAAVLLVVLIPTVLTDTAAAADYVVVDDECYFWTEGGLRQVIEEYQNGSMTAHFVQGQDALDAEGQELVITSDLTIPSNIRVKAGGASVSVAEGATLTLEGELVLDVGNTVQGPGSFVNNGIYGMTGGQMAPTTLIGQKATTAPKGRTKEQAGMPIRMAEMLSTLDGCVYAERVCVTDIPHLNKAKKAIRKAFEKQMAGEGFTFIEVLSTCPTNWGMTPLKANEWLKNEMAAYYPLGVIKESTPEVKGHEEGTDRCRFRRPGRAGHRQEPGRGRDGRGPERHLGPLLRPRDARRHRQLLRGPLHRAGGLPRLRPSL